MSVRRSTRLVATQKHLREESEDAPNDQQQSENDDLLAKAKTHRKKRKTVVSEISRPVHKKTRGMRGNRSASFKELPYDVLFEIFISLEPADLLSLARTTKDLRSILMSPQLSKTIWKLARSNVQPKLPDLPNDLSEPAYAELLFENTCHYCQRRGNKSTRPIYRIMYARRRICRECVPTQCEKRQYYNHLTSQLSIPFFQLHGRDRINSSGRYEEWSFQEYSQVWKAKYEELPAESQQDWLDNHRKHRSLISDHADECDRWFKEDEYVRKCMIEENREKAQEMIIARIKFLGWSEELSKSYKNKERAFWNTPAIVRLCRTKVTIQTVETLDSQINEHMIAIKERRLAREHTLALDDRLCNLEEAHIVYMTTAFKGYHKAYPTTQELFLEPTILALFTADPDTSFTSDQIIGFVTDIFPGAAERLRLRVNEQLSLSLKATFPAKYSKVTDFDDILNLATSVFKCSQCHESTRWHVSTIALWYENVLWHHCAFTKKPPAFEAPQYITDLMNKNKFEYRSFEDKFTVNEEAVHLVASIIKRCGLDPSTTTKKMMDDANPLFQCDCTISWNKGHLVTGWRGLVNHFFKHHFKNGKFEGLHEVELLTGIKATTAGKQLRKAITAEWTENYPPGCALCGKWMGLERKKDVVLHICTRHNISTKITGKYFVARPHSQTTASSIIFYMEEGTAKK